MVPWYGLFSGDGVAHSSYLGAIRPRALQRRQLRPITSSAEYPVIAVKARLMKMIGLSG
jgi:hypothetical protein